MINSLSSGTAVAFDALEKINEGAGRCFTVSHQFSTAAGQQAVQTVKVTLADIGLNTLKTVYIDNSTNNAPLSITMGGTRQIIVAPSYSQGFYRVLGGFLDLDYTAVSFSGNTATIVNVNLLWLNYIACDPLIWWQPGASVGLPFTDVAIGANTALTATVPVIAGRTPYVIGLSVTASGATAEGTATATLTGAANQYGSATLSWQLNAPADVNGELTPLLLTFSPPLVGMLGGSMTLNLPALGAGNTNAKLNIYGYYI